MKMYILIKETVTDKLVPVICAHASLACFRKFENDKNMQMWINGIFKKVVCAVNETEFNNVRTEGKNIILAESTLNNEEVCIAFCPQEECSPQFKYFKMWKPNGI